MAAPARPRGGSDAGAWLLALALALLAIGLLQPKVALNTILHRHVLVFDISQSMSVMDADGGARTRIELAQQASFDALARLACGSEVGVALFTGHRSLLLFTPVEVCTHFDEITEVIESIDWRMSWEFRSEVAKGVHSALIVLGALEKPATLVFLTDGHEAPPVNPLLPPRFRGRPGEVRGVLVGVGGNSPVPIPKFAPDGSQTGYFGAAEVMQIDAFSQGRATGDGSETMVNDAGEALPVSTASGTEHLSSLREEYLRGIAAGLALDYRRLASSDDLVEVMTLPGYGREQRGLVDLRWMLALAAFIALLAAFVIGMRSRPGSG